LCFGSLGFISYIRFTSNGESWSRKRLDVDTYVVVRFLEVLSCPLVHVDAEHSIPFPNCKSLIGKRSNWRYVCFGLGA